MKRIATMTVIAILMGASTARAEDVPTRDTQARVAQVVTLAALTPLLCPDLAVNKRQMQVMLVRAGLSEADLKDPLAFGTEDNALAQSAVRSFKADGARFCAEMLHDLGPDIADLVRPARPDDAR